MKKFSKVLALGMALSLAFGVTAFAAGSVTVDTSDLASATMKDVIPDADETITIDALTQEQVTSATEELEKSTVVESILAEAQVTESENVTLKVAKAFDASVDGDIDGTITITFYWDEFDSQNKYVVLHYNGATWDIVTATITEGGVEASFDSLSPIVIVEVGETEPDEGGDDTTDPGTTTNPGTTTTPSGNGNTSSNNTSQSSSQSEAPKSPKTGEMLPMAGIMALICLAGAAICAGKVRYNKQ